MTVSRLQVQFTELLEVSTPSIKFNLDPSLLNVSVSGVLLAAEREYFIQFDILIWKKVYFVENNITKPFTLLIN
jgi:hypothetical protein